GVPEAVEGRVGGGDLGECQTLLLNLSLQAQSSDCWHWQPNPDKGYSVHGAYQLLTSHDSIILDTA
ncbi:hypothetical protein A2U01_0105136, partial [Trifolium medium]|nr:hypothetical protein [Trifolium medium]